VSRRAVRAGAENFEGVGDVDEPMVAARSSGPPFDFGSFDFDGDPALTTYEVVVMLVAGAAAVAGFAVVTSEGVELARFGEGPYLVVDGGEGDVLALGLKLGMEVLGGAKPIGGIEDSGEGALLARRALLRRAGGPTARTNSRHGLATDVLVVVPVAFVKGVPVTVVDVVDVIVVGDGDVAAAFAVGVVVARMFGVAVGGALVEMVTVSGMQVPVVDVVDVVAVRDGDVAATLAMHMGVASVFDMGGGHGWSSWECRMASLTMWPTWASASW